MKDWKESLNKLSRYKYPLIVLVLGIVLMLLPIGKTGAAPASANDQDILLRQVLSCTEGVGNAQVIVSEKGVVVVCEGADSAAVRLDIIRAIGSYTGFGADRITVLKMVQQ